VEHEKGVMDPDLFDEIPDGSNKSFFQEWFQRLEKLEFKYIDRESGYCTPLSPLYPYLYPIPDPPNPRPISPKN
jgi:hypothetical protein